MLGNLQSNKRQSCITFEHVLALLLEDASTDLKILALKEVGNSDSLRFGRAGGDGLLLLLLLLHLLLLHLLLAHLLLLHHVLAHGLSLELLDVLWDSHAILLRLDGQLTLHSLDLLRSGLLAGLESGRHQVDLWLTGLRLALLLRWLLLLRRFLRWCRHSERVVQCLI